jgi:hypothetical protein
MAVAAVGSADVASRRLKLATEVVELHPHPATTDERPLYAAMR